MSTIYKNPSSDDLFGSASFGGGGGGGNSRARRRRAEAAKASAAAKKKREAAQSVSLDTRRQQVALADYKKAGINPSDDSGDSCTTQDPYGVRNMKFVSPAPTPRPSANGSNEKVSALCNLGRGMSTAAQITEGAKKGRFKGAADGFGVVGEIIASVACPASGTTKW